MKHPLICLREYIVYILLIIWNLVQVAILDVFFRGNAVFLQGLFDETIGNGVVFYNGCRLNEGDNNIGVSKNNGTPKSSIFIGFSLINHPFWGTTIFGNTHI